MDKKIQAILLSVVSQLKKLNWKLSDEWAITIKTDGNVSISKKIPVSGNISDQEIHMSIPTYVNFKLDSTDEITYFPNITVNAQINIDGGQLEDVEETGEIDVAFTNDDYKHATKATDAAKKINRNVEDFINTAFEKYISNNSDSITHQN